MILSLAASELPIVVFERTAPPGAVITNGELLLEVCLCSLAVTILVWSVAYFAYRRPRRMGFGRAQCVAGWAIITLASVAFVFLGPPAAHLRSDGAPAEAAIERYNADVPGAYRAELHSLGFPEQLSPSGLARDDIGETETRLKTIRLDIARYRDLAESKAVALRQQIADSSASPAYKANLLGRIDREAAAQHVLRQRYWSDEDARAREWIEIVELLRANPGRWGLDKGGLAFRPDLFAEVKPHNDVIAEIDADEREICQTPGACPSR
ncbi:MAG TPA: hypothetical protein VG248_16700 [Caulobacteraceae bacterium]|nr:hypothetical protein [Caulobacteraceae bacterium]